MENEQNHLQGRKQFRIRILVILSRTQNNPRQQHWLEYHQQSDSISKAPSPSYTDAEAVRRKAVERNGRSERNGMDGLAKDPEITVAEGSG